MQGNLHRERELGDARRERPTRVHERVERHGALVVEHRVRRARHDVVVDELVVVVREGAHGAMHALHPGLVELRALERELLDEDVERGDDFALQERRDTRGASKG